jgi:hypothetical protein
MIRRRAYRFAPSPDGVYNPTDHRPVGVGAPEFGGGTP